ncbi:tRNA (N(6)-L-threonylcarbamoyladenosine(37)-C(2))-methylthiotransferase MtaB [Methylomagnum sp.]
MRVNLKTLGCRLNEAELETWARQFQGDGHRLVDDTEEADLVVFNSCAVTQDAVRKSRNLLRKAARENPTAKLVLSGCYATLNRDEAEGLGVDLVVANADKHRLVDIAKRELDLPAMPAASTEPGESALFRLGRHRAFVKVQDGCRYRCTYCIVTVARGEEHSRPALDIIDEINDMHRLGIQEAVLTGVHLGGYGSDLDSNLTELVRAVLERTAIPRLRLGSLEPWDIPGDFVALFENPRLTPHLHLPLQSGSDTVLKRMARRCRTAEFADLAGRLRAAVPDMNITTDIIVGFPGETDAEWADSLAFAEKMAFGGIHIFSYSPRAGTAAADMANPVHGEVKKARSRALHELAERQKRAFFAKHVGREFPVLWEGTRTSADGRTEIYGYTPNYVKVGMVVESAGLSYRVTMARLVRVAESGEFVWAGSVYGTDSPDSRTD